jgi:hypothetical protein
MHDGHNDSRRSFFGKLVRLAGFGAGTLLFARRAEACAIYCRVLYCDITNVRDCPKYWIASVYRCTSRCGGSFMFCKDWRDCQSFCYSRQAC